MNDSNISRRKALKQGGVGLAALALGPNLLSISRPLTAQSVASIGVLESPDSNGIRLPAGFSSRVIASAGMRLRRSFWSRTSYRWHSYPDGGATYPTDDGGWIYVSNSETLSFLGGGASAVRFSSSGQIIDAYRILGGTNTNCAGGATPWGTWLSCEEIDFGRVFECDPYGEKEAIVRPALGYFKHEAAAVDPTLGQLFLTEDESDGRFYRYLPDGVNAQGQLNLDSGHLQVAEVDEAGAVTWHDVPEPNPSLFETPTREQVPASTAFRGGEGIWYTNGAIYFTTKGDNRVWRYDPVLETIEIVYDASTASNPILTGVDNITASSGGDLLVAEDGGDMQICVIDANGEVAPLLQVVGQDDSEITGPAFNPDGDRLYFSSQRGSALFGGGNGFGITYEIRGPFHQILTV